MESPEKNKNSSPPSHEEIMRRELEIIAGIRQGYLPPENLPGIYTKSDWNVLPGYFNLVPDYKTLLKSLEDLLDYDKKREEDGFPRRIRLGKLIKPSRNDKSKVVVVPTSTEPKFYHDDSITEDNEETTGGSGEGEEGEVIGQQQAQPQKGEGEGQGAGQGEGTDHDVSSEAFDLGKILTEKFSLPNLQNKGKKRAFSKYTYDLTDINRGFGQLLDKKATLKRIIETNILLGRIDKDKPFDPENLLIGPKDHVYRILSKEKDFETQAVVFFIRDYSGSMQGAPAETISTQHLFIYSWLMYQYQNNVQTRFILHDTGAKEVPDFYTYFQSQVAGGTRVAPAFQMALDIILKENLHKDFNIYIFYGTDGDDWDNDGKELKEVITTLLSLTNRIGITVAKNSWGGTGQTIVEKNMTDSGILLKYPKLIRLDSFDASGSNEDRIIEGIKKLVSDT
ncbi:MAG: hypothetical protein CVU05_13290 [Bacteroidetes bacterium HGW-Bacteroidetes-21]|nr:MAG: hypothetical protein CVU05_13290 [Bacteroidetes bacterium HGW-Bacteroidetes-21]